MSRNGLAREGNGIKGLLLAGVGLPFFSLYTPSGFSQFFSKSNIDVKSSWCGECEYRDV